MKKRIAWNKGKRKYTKTCPNCGKLFKTSISYQIRCSRFCYDEHRPRRKYRKEVSIKCDECGKDFILPIFRLDKSKRHFCSTHCKNIACGKEKRLYKYPKIVGKCTECNKEIIAKYMAMDKPNRKYCSTYCRARAIRRVRNPMDHPGAREKASISQKNRPKETRKWKEYRRYKWADKLKGSNSQFWKGGLTEQNRLLRNSVKTKIWREKVFEKDDYTCQKCGDRSGKGHAVYLTAHHIKAWAKYPELRFDIENGITLCKNCHRKTDNFGYKATL